ncbi:hypothetical protein FEM48_Zijuj04G0019400 [Ziziphus jujuba var. spinosa]|uniref:GDSL esterase/lipase At5g14450-like n=1 Tax=Ziziphus jujuba var. spinosa TaxID=714518 RepID=A0A978VH65_ZIZJJ|nr:hypothetical protein FEM48_Zijuj04G0019400 [Ziziphus jujuba var. spinosa]
MDKHIRNISFVISILVSILVMSVNGGTHRLSCNFPAIYNFGDSNSDTGGSSAAFWPANDPKGETFFHRPAGRGSDGRLIIDFMAEHFGLPLLSPYLDSLGTNFRHGANFAIGGSTIRRLNESMFLNGVPPFPTEIQVVQFRNFKERSTRLYKQAKRKSERRGLPRPDDFTKSLFTFDTGQNDLAAGFRTMTNDQFVKEIPDIINKLADGISNLYNEGARAFWIHNTGPIGCLAVTLRGIHDPLPGYLDRHGCVKFQNDMAIEFNKQLKKKVMELRKKLPLAAFTYIDMFAAKYKLITDAKKEGFLDKAEICCGYHENNNHVWCGNDAIINGTKIHAGSCKDPSKYVSWDGVHYTEAANHWIADYIINGSFSDTKLPLSQACHRLPLQSQVELQ